MFRQKAFVINRECTSCRRKTRDPDITHCTYCGQKLPEVVLEETTVVICSTCDNRDEDKLRDYCGLCGSKTKEITKFRPATEILQVDNW